MAKYYFVDAGGNVQEFQWERDENQEVVVGLHLLDIGNQRIRLRKIDLMWTRHDAELHRLLVLDKIAESAKIL